MTVIVHAEPVEGCELCAEPEFCQATVHEAVFYLSNGDPGYPAEGCDNEALPGTEFCADHTGEDPWDAADRMYEEARDRRLEEQDD